MSLHTPPSQHSHPSAPQFWGWGWAWLSRWFHGEGGKREWSASSFTQTQRLWAAPASQQRGQEVAGCLRVSPADRTPPVDPGD